MICVSLGNITFNELMQQLNNVDMAEIRIDLLNLTNDELEQVFGSHPNLIATCRPESVGRNVQQQKLLAAISAGAKWIDLEVEAPAAFRQSMVNAAKQKGCRVIVSYHNYDTTPSTLELKSIVEGIFAEGADVAKVATMAGSKADAARILGLYDLYHNLVALAMGKEGVVTRIAAPLLGAPFTFAAPYGNKTAPGQLDKHSMELIYDTLRSHE